VVLNTLSSLINNVIQFEKDLSSIYRNAIENVNLDKEYFINLIDENLNICKKLERAYRDSVTDTLESTFFLSNFQLPSINVNPDLFKVKTELERIEKDCIACYEKIAEAIKNYNKIIYKYFEKLLQEHKECYNKLLNIER
jgi:rubrerythrin